MRGETIWADFITTFRPATNRTWEKPALVKWVDLLATRGIQVRQDRTSSPTTKFIDLLYRECDVGFQPMNPQSPEVDKTEVKEDGAEEAAVRNIRAMKDVTT